MPHAIANTTNVLSAVAKFEFTPSIPTFAKIEVSAANTADKSAKTAHIIFLRSLDDVYYTAKVIRLPDFIPNVTAQT